MQSFLSEIAVHSHDSAKSILAVAEAESELIPLAVNLGRLAARQGDRQIASPEQLFLGAKLVQRGAVAVYATVAGDGLYLEEPHRVDGHLLDKEADFGRKRGKHGKGTGGCFGGLLNDGLLNDGLIVVNPAGPQAHLR